METISRTKPKARIDHRCNFCNGRILKGEQYNKQTNVYDGQIYDWKSHLDCQWIAQKLRMYDDMGDGGLTQDEFIEHIQFTFMRLNDTTDDVAFGDKLNFVIKHYKEN